MMLSWVAALVLAAPSPACSTNAKGFCTDRVVRYALETADPYPVIRINVALGKVTTVELAGDDMKGEGAPVVGNAAILQVDAARDLSRVFISPRAPSKLLTSRSDEVLTDKDLIDLDLRTNVQIDIEGGMHVLVEVRIGDEAEAVERLVLDFPERRSESAYVRDRMAKVEARLHNEYAQKERTRQQEVRELAAAQMAHDMLERFQCRDLRHRKMRDLVALEATRICRIGDKVHISFRVHNRSRMLFIVDKLEVTKRGADAADSAARVEYKAADKFVAFNQELLGMVTVPVGATTEANVFAMTVRENGGRGRAITLDDVGI